MKRIAILWDLENVKLHRLLANQTLFKAIQRLGATKGKIQHFKVYGSLVGKRQTAFKTFCLQHKAEYFSINSAEKNALDARLVFDCIHLIDSPSPPDTVILVAGDQDYKPLLRCLRQSRVYTIVLTQHESGCIRLQKAADEFLRVSELLSLPQAA